LGGGTRTGSLISAAEESTLRVSSGGASQTGSSMASKTRFNCEPQLRRIIWKYWFCSSMVTKRVTARSSFS
jgi:hypothetical protein